MRRASVDLGAEQAFAAHDSPASGDGGDVTTPPYNWIEKSARMGKGDVATGEAEQAARGARRKGAEQPGGGGVVTLEQPTADAWKDQAGEEQEEMAPPPSPLPGSLEP